MLLSFRKLSKLMCENAPRFLKFRVALVTGASASSSGLLRPSSPTPPARPQGGRPVWRGDAAGTSAIALCAWRCASGSGRTRGRRADAQGSRAGLTRTLEPCFCAHLGRRRRPSCKVLPRPPSASTPPFPSYQEWAARGSRPWPHTDSPLAEGSGPWPRPPRGAPGTLAEAAPLLRVSPFAGRRSGAPCRSRLPRRASRDGCRRGRS